MIDPREVFIKSVDLSNSSIINRPGYVFFCGGVISTGTEPFKSLRDYIHGRLLVSHTSIVESRFVLAEDVIGWNYVGYYSNLIDLEKDIANLSDKIFLISESPGSIAELGAFSVIDDVVEKLTVIISRKDYNEQSFVRLGPLDYLIGFDEQLVKPYPWNVRYTLAVNNIIPNYIKNDLDQIYDNILDDIIGALPVKNRKSKYNTKNSGDAQLLILDMLDLFLVLTLQEILHYLEILDISCSERRLKQLLFLLESFNLINKIEYGGYIFYSPGKRHERKYVSYSFLREKYVFDRSSLKMQCKHYYKESYKKKYRYLLSGLANE